MQLVLVEHANFENMLELELVWVVDPNWDTRAHHQGLCRVAKTASGRPAPWGECLLLMVAAALIEISPDATSSMHFLMVSSVLFS